MYPKFNFKDGIFQVLLNSKLILLDDVTKHLEAYQQVFSVVAS